MATKRTRPPDPDARRLAALPTRKFLERVDRHLSTLYLALLEKTRTSGALRDLLAVRYRARFKALAPPQRQAFLQAEVAGLWHRSVEERAQELLEAWVLEIAWHRRRDRGSPDAVARRRWGYPPTPHLILQEPHGVQRILALTNPLPAIQKEVRAFVLASRTLMKIRVPRGRKRGRRAVSVNPAETLLLAYLFEKRHLTKPDLLKLCDRVTIPEDYHWLDRRLTLGHELLLRYKASTVASLDTWPLNAIRGIIMATT